MTPLTLAVPKGRILGALIPLLERAGLDASPLQESDRRLVRSSADGALRYVFLKPDDVTTYVDRDRRDAAREPPRHPGDRG